jgi:hypothetical protein
VESENVVLKFKQRGISDVSLASLVGRNLLGFFKLSGQVGGKGQVEGGFSVFPPPAFHLSQAFGFREARF